MDQPLEIVNRKNYTVRMREQMALSFDYWTLPITAEYPQDQDQVALVRIGAGVPLLQVQRKAAGQVLDSIGVRHGLSKWSVTRQALESKATKFLGDPELVVNWKRPGIGVKINAAHHIQKIPEDFFTEFVQQGWVKSTAVAKVLWKAFCLHSLHWMINRRKPLDLLFCELHPFPFRPNWKSIVLNEEMKAQKKRSLVPKWSEVAIRGFVAKARESTLLKPDILFFNKHERYIYWTLDVRPTTVWWKAVASREDAKKSYMGGDYYSNFVSEMRESIPAALKVYGAWLREISKPGFVYRDFTNVKSEDRFTGPGGDGVIPAHEIVPAPVAYDSRTGQEKPSESLTATETAEVMLALSGLQSSIKDVRDAGGPEPEPG